MINRRWAVSNCRDAAVESGTDASCSGLIVPEAARKRIDSADRSVPPFPGAHRRHTNTKSRGGITEVIVNEDVITSGAPPLVVYKKEAEVS